MKSALKIITIQTSSNEFTVCAYYSDGSSESSAYRVDRAYDAKAAVKSLMEEKGIKGAFVHTGEPRKVKTFINLEGQWPQKLVVK